MEYFTFDDQLIYTFVNTECHQVFQSAPYIEGGWYIVHDCLSPFTPSFTLWEIPLYGGEAQRVDTFRTFELAFKHANKYLT